jgi:hypothetical protein
MARLLREHGWWPDPDAPPFPSQAEHDEVACGIRAVGAIRKPAQHEVVLGTPPPEIEQPRPDSDGLDPTIVLNCRADGGHA